MRDPYAALGCPRDADAGTLKRAYRRIVKENHPDRNPGDAKAEARFKEAAAAWDLLGDPDKRARFDRGEIDAEGRERAPFGGFGNFGGQGGFDPGDLFGDIFSGFRNRPRRGADTRYRVQVPFIDAARGGSVRLTLKSGRSIALKVPPATEDGARLRLAGRGEPGPSGGPPGDAEVEISVEPHPWFRREGRTILVDLPVSLAEAVRGGRVRAPTLDGPVTVRIAPMTSSGARLRLKGKGVPDPEGGPRGDQILRVMIQLPRDPDPALAEAAEDRADADPRVEAGMA